ncbi:MAG: cellulase family glycosylhydrolase [Clostridia bacterium]|nr:cellulase family glycosylhydrolase [Clostridia bacterium]
MKHVGFNFLWMYTKHRADKKAAAPDLRQLDFLAEEGFNFVRLPTDYRYFVRAGEEFAPDEANLKILDGYIKECADRGLHVNFCLHRAPGYCINRPFARENLWQSEAMQEQFVTLWRRFAERYRHVPAEVLSFDLLNEPTAMPSNPGTEEDYVRLVRRTVEAIRQISPDRPITADGYHVGSSPVLGLAELNLTQSGRGYFPMQISHYEASWVDSAGWPPPTYPLKLGDKTVDRGAIAAFYAPWREAERRGVRVHIGECGCHNRTHQDVAVAWLRDLISVYDEFGWGYALWNFEESFGILENGRPGERCEDYRGFRVNREMLEIMKHSLEK